MAIYSVTALISFIGGETIVFSAGYVEADSLEEAVKSFPGNALLQYELMPVVPEKPSKIIQRVLNRRRQA